MHANRSPLSYHWIAFTVAAGISMPSWAFEHHFSCPLKVEASTLHVDAPSKEWLASTQGVLLLNSAAPMDGPPSNMAPLTPYSSGKHNGLWIETWKLDGEFPDGKFMSCGYGDANLVLLSKRIDDAIKDCTVIYAIREGRRNINEILCK